MGSPPQMKSRSVIPPADEAKAPAAPRPVRPPSLSKRLPHMTDARLVSVHGAAVRISNEEGHPRQGAAKNALPLIEAEIGKRAEAPFDATAGADKR